MEKKITKILGSGDVSLPLSLTQMAGLLNMEGDASKLREFAYKLSSIIEELEAAGPPATVQVCSLSTDPESEVELAMTIRFHGDMDGFVLSFYGRSAGDTKVRAPLRDLSLDEIRGYVLNARQWAERHGFAFDLGELVETIVAPLEVAS